MLNVNFEAMREKILEILEEADLYGYSNEVIADKLLNLHSVSKSFTAEQIEAAYDVGFENGCEHARPAY